MGLTVMLNYASLTWVCITLARRRKMCTCCERHVSGVEREVVCSLCSRVQVRVVANRVQATEMSDEEMKSDLTGEYTEMVKVL
jgi:hypothetical protein